MLENAASDASAIPGLMKPHYRFFGAYRLFLAVMVLCQHFQYLLPEQARWPFQRWGLGIDAVCIFFVISGFIIAEAIATYYMGRAWNFLGNRLLRVVPPYLVALTGSIIAHQLLWSAGHLQVWDFSFTENPVSLKSIVINVLLLLPGIPKSIGDQFQFIPFVWSLRAELLFYTLAFVATWIAARKQGERGAGPWGRTVFALSIVFGFGLLGLFFWHGSPLLLGNSVYFLIGVLLFLWVREPGPRSTIFLALAAAAVALAIPAHYRLVPAQFPWIRSEQLLIMLFLLLVLIVLIRFRPAAATARRWKRFDRVCGDLSYPLYLNHYVVGIALFNLSSDRGFGLYAAGIALSFLVAAAMNRIVEIPLRSIRSRIRGATV